MAAVDYDLAGTLGGFREFLLSIESGPGCGRRSSGEGFGVEGKSVVFLVCEIKGVAQQSGRRHNDFGRGIGCHGFRKIP